MGQNSNRQEAGDHQDIITDDANTNNNNRQEQDDDDKKLLLQKIKLSGNFHNYREMKRKQFQSDSDDTAKDRSSAATAANKDHEQWNHFMTPLKPFTPSHHSGGDSSIRTESAINTTDKSKPQKSVFSDLERTQTIDRFGDIFMNRMGNVMTSGKLSTAWSSSISSNSNITSVFSWLYVDYSPNAAKTKHRETVQTIINPQDYAEERHMMTPHLSPFVWGATCTVLTLFSMRFGRWYQGRTLDRGAASFATSNASRSTQTISSSAAALERNILQDLRRYKPPQSYGQNNLSNHPSSYQQQKNAMLSNLSTLPVDLAISLLVGISTSIFLTRPADLLNDMSKAPLLKGKSVLSEELCVPFADEMERINRGFHTYTSSGDNLGEKKVVSFKEMWRDENMGDFDSLKAIRNFVENCHRREASSVNDERRR